MTNAQPTTLTARLRAEILAGRLAPGDRLIELQLTKRFNEGRAALRSALVELEKEGLVQREANRGAVVRRISLAEVLQITEARCALETLVAQHAARRATRADRTALTKLLTSMRDAVSRRDYVTYSECNGVLHARLREISDHRVANELVRNLRDRATSHQFRLALMPGRAEESLPQHEAIINAVVAGDELAAADAMRKHLESVVEVLQRWADVGLPT